LNIEGKEQKKDEDSYKVNSNVGDYSDLLLTPEKPTMLRGHTSTVPRAVLNA
jgi:hypothetical protein